MDLLQQALDGIQSVDLDADVKRSAAEHLRRWLTAEEFAAYRPQLGWLIAQKQWAGLLDRFYQILPFGTGGRRGAVGIGPNRMNLWTLTASVQGHCEYLKERFPGVSPLHVVLAYDVRRFEDQRKNYNPGLPNPVLHLSSKTFAHHAAAVYAANGIHAHLPAEGHDRYLATPELSFFIRKLAAHGGLNISASHNPPDDNGGKFYDERGGQPVPPDDQIMADLVDQVAAIKELPWPDALRSDLIHFLDDQLHQAYIDLCRKQGVVGPPRFGEIQVVFTPLHGVGSMTAMEVLLQQGFQVRPVAEQMLPDGQFPNVTQTPNPEVPASMDRAQALAESVHADLVLATDPDADRLGAMVPDEAGKFRFVNGNTLAALLTHFKLAKLAESKRMPANPMVIKTLVTTGLVTRIAHGCGAQVVEDLLVGFKYIAEVLWQLEQTGSYEDVQGRPDDFILGCEESHGILTTPQIRDKDAGGAALLMTELALDVKRNGSSILQYLDAIHRRFGFFSNLLHTIVMPGVEGKQNMGRMLDRLRKSPPAAIAGLKVIRVDDLLDENGWLGPLKGATDRAARNFIILHLDGAARIALRPSGTEPKAKMYVETCSPPCREGTGTLEWTRICKATEELSHKLIEEFTRIAKESPVR